MKTAFVCQKIPLEIKNEICEYYKSNIVSLKECKDKFGYSKFVIRKILDEFAIAVRTPDELSKYHNGFKKSSDDKFAKLVTSINSEELEKYYRSNGFIDTAEYYHLTQYMLDKVLSYFNIKRLTSKEARYINFINKYGSIEAGLDEIRKKTISTNMEKYGTSNVAQSDEIKQKIQNTNIQNYGGISPFCSQDVRKKATQTNMQRYGVENVFQSEEIQNKAHATQLDKYDGIGFSSKSIVEKYNNTMIDKYGVQWGCLTDSCIKSSRGCNSSSNIMFKTALEKSGIEFVSEFVLDNFRYDFKVENVLIEIDPSFTHSTTNIYNKNKFGGVDSNYHIKKSHTAELHGYRCIHVWDWDNVDKIVELLNPKPKLYARKCVVKEISKSQSDDFCNTHHLQGRTKDSVRLGLIYDNELVSIMTFGKPRYNNKFEWELIRYCSNSQVIGGAEKLFAYFARNYNPKSIISYCDRSKFLGNTYLKLGFITNSLITPSKHWYNISTKKHVTDNLLRQRGFDQLFGTNFGKGTSNEQLMRDAGFVEIYDCGQQTYKYYS